MRVQFWTNKYGKTLFELGRGNEAQFSIYETVEYNIPFTIDKKYVYYDKNDWFKTKIRLYSEVQF